MMVVTWSAIVTYLTWAPACLLRRSNVTMGHNRKIADRDHGLKALLPFEDEWSPYQGYVCGAPPIRVDVIVI